MSRIRTVKPELFHHESLFDAELGSGLPLRLAFIGLFTVADFKGCFLWKPRTLKLMLLRVIRDERETGVLTDEMRIGWTNCQPILDLGDEVGARMAFRETYSREVENARKMAVAARWTPTIGTDPTLREKRLTDALMARKIGVGTVTALLPGPTPTAIAQVAGLLAGPNASAAEAQVAANLKRLPHILRSASADAEQRRAEERQQQRQNEAAKKAAIRELLAQHQRNNDAEQETA